MTDSSSLCLAPIAQSLHSSPVGDVAAAVRTALEAGGLRTSVHRGQRIAITAGSRGISNIRQVLLTVVESVKERGAEPFLVPAMGSHGGATDDGQANLLAETFDIDDVSMGCPVLSSMDVVELGRSSPHDLPVYLDRYAAGADGIIVVNRVKPHTDFTGRWESGLMKMIAIGLGKRAQAESIHAHGAWGLRELMPEVARAKIALAPFRLGLAIIEDGYDQTCAIVGVPSDQIEQREPGLLQQARDAMARLPFEEIDLLIVDQIGKEFSGAGMDPNVLGRKRIEGEEEFTVPRVERIIARDLSDATHGNGVGIGLADIITRRLLDRIDWEVTNTNSLVSGFTIRSMVPYVAESDRVALETALFLLRRKPVEQLRVVRIPNTLHLENLWASPALLADDGSGNRVRPAGEPEPLRFDSVGSLV